MKDQILELLLNSGPLTLAQIEEKTGFSMVEICNAISICIIRREVHLEGDGSIWYAGEKAA